MHLVDRKQMEPKIPCELLLRLVSPMMGYYICDHFIGTELRQFNELPWPSSNPNDMIKSKNYTVLQGDVIYVQVDQFNFFVKDVLPNIGNPFRLVTGQWNLPALQANATTDYVLRHPLLIKWWSQNPIYVKQHKYEGIPFGIMHKSLPKYAEALQNFDTQASRPQKLLHQYCHISHPDRARLPAGGWLWQEEFYAKLKLAQYVISPAGDREDCYRHMEAIGLGCKPLCNVGPLLAELYDPNMTQASIDTMLQYLQDSDGLEVPKVDNNLVFVSYWTLRIRGE
jgi:hypothetical protein